MLKAVESFSAGMLLGLKAKVIPFRISMAGVTSPSKSASSFLSPLTCLNYLKLLFTSSWPCVAFQQLPVQSVQELPCSTL